MGVALAVVLAGGCASGPRTGGEEAPGRPEASSDADTFTARQSRLELVETGPDGEALSLRFTDLGPLDAPVVVFVHGVPTSSWMYREAIDRELLADRPEIAAGVLILNTIGAPGGFPPPAAMDNVFVQAGMRAVGFERDATIRSIVAVW